jgi:hypothetical protein
VQVKPPARGSLATATKQDAIGAAAEPAAPVFALNGWKWRDDPETPTALDIAATFSALAWTLRDKYGFQGDGKMHFAATGRLIVTMEANGTIRYGVQLSTEF